MLAVAPPLGRRRDAPWQAALLGAVHARTGLPTRSLAGTTVACVSSHSSVHPQSRGRVCDGSDICGAEERRARGRARSALRALTRRDCSSAANAVSVASFATGHETEYRREPFAQRRAAAFERRRIPARGFARSCFAGSNAKPGESFVSSRQAKACIVGAFEHPTRKAPDKTVAQLHAECAAGALADAGLSKSDIDGYFCSGDAPGMGPTSMIDYLNLQRAPHREHRSGRHVVHLAGGARARCDRGRPLQRRADHAGRPAAQRRLQRHRAAHARRHARGAVGGAVRHHHRQRLRHGRDAAHARVRHHVANNWRGSRWPRRTMRSTTRTRCCATWSPCKTCSTRR